MGCFFLGSGEFFGLKSWGSANITVETQAAPDQRWHKSQMVPSNQSKLGETVIDGSAISDPMA
jgi:hypothetical protein